MSAESHVGYTLYISTHHFDYWSQAKIEHVQLFTAKKPAMFVLKRSNVNVTFSLNLYITVLWWKIMVKVTAPTIRSWSRFQNVIYIYFMCTQEQQSLRERTLMNYYSSKLYYLQFLMTKSGERSHKTQIYQLTPFSECGVGYSLFTSCLLGPVFRMLHCLFCRNTSIMFRTEDFSNNY